VHTTFRVPTKPRRHVGKCAASALVVKRPFAMMKATGLKMSFSFSMTFVLGKTWSVGK